jgi:hypothetical protein
MIINSTIFMRLPEDVTWRVFLIFRCAPQRDDPSDMYSRFKMIYYGS